MDDLDLEANLDSTNERPGDVIQSPQGLSCGIILDETVNIELLDDDVESYSEVYPTEVPQQAAPTNQSDMSNLLEHSEAPSFHGTQDSKTTASDILTFGNGNDTDTLEFDLDSILSVRIKEKHKGSVVSSRPFDEATEEPKAPLGIQVVSSTTADDISAWDMSTLGDTVGGGSKDVIVNPSEIFDGMPEKPNVTADTSGIGNKLTEDHMGSTIERKDNLEISTLGGTGGDGIRKAVLSSREPGDDHRILDTAREAGTTLPARQGTPVPENLKRVETAHIKIRDVSTEDSSANSKSGSKDSTLDRQFPYIKKVIYIGSAILAPILLTLLCALVIGLNRLRNEEEATSPPARTTVILQNPGDALEAEVSSPPRNEFNESLPSESNQTHQPSSAVPIKTSQPIPLLTFFPINPPTLKPTSVTSAPVPAKTPETKIPVTKPTHQPSLSVPGDDKPKFEQPPYPRHRYVLWNTLSDRGMFSSFELGYTSSTWNRPYSADIEALSHADILDQGFLPRSAMETLGFDEASVWNCWINHYNGFTWEEIGVLELSGGQGSQADRLFPNLTAYGRYVQRAFEDLGWTEETWDSRDPTQSPSTWNLSWNNLSDTEKNAAAALCYNEPLWNLSAITGQGVTGFM